MRYPGIRRVALATVVTMMVVAGGNGSAAAEPRRAALRSPAQPVSWSGSVHAGATPLADVAECRDRPCDRFDLDIALPPGLRAQPDTTVEVAIRWSNVFDTLGLHVYRGATLIASTTLPFATAQSVLIPARSISRGTYSVYVSYDPANSADEHVTYEGLVEVEHAPKERPVRRLLPDLAVPAQRNVTFDAPFGFFEPAPEPGQSCFASEVDEEGAQLCLRFDQVLANVGEGPLEMRFALPKHPGSTQRAITQRLRWSDDPSSYEDVPAGQWEFHAVHDHYHYTGFALSRLWSADDDGQRTGSAPVRVGHKVSFCIVDIEIVAWAEKGNGPRSYSFPNCLVPTEADEASDYLVQGITPGWADIYDWFLPDQYIDVAGLGDGRYILETTADPDDTIIEADESNNCGAVAIQLSGMATAAPSAAIVGPGPACSTG